MGKKSTKTAKQPVRLREKLIKGGNKSLYLDVYTDGRRQYEFLKLYLVPERTVTDKTINEATKRQAQAIQAQRIIEVNTDIHGFEVTSVKAKIKLYDYIISFAEKKRQQTGKIECRAALNFFSLARQIEQYKGKDTMLKDINTVFCKGFLEYLKTATDGRRKYSKQLLNENTQFGYMKRLGTILNTAKKDKIIRINPLEDIEKEDKPKKRQTDVCYLTIDELKLLEKTPLEPYVKQPFLFACYAGLRFSDVQNLTWNKLQKDNEGRTFLNYGQQKTLKREYLPLSEKALTFLPGRNSAKETDNVFNLPCCTHTNRLVKRWAALAGVKKHLTFHVARHTAATLILSLGASIETVSKILGHSDIKTTQIYAKITAQAQKEAMNKLDTLL